MPSVSADPENRVTRRHGWARVGELGLARPLGQRDPHRGRGLGRQLVEAQRGQQAEYAARNLLGDLGERVFGGDGMLAGRVDAPCLPLDHPLAHESLARSQAAAGRSAGGSHLRSATQVSALGKSRFGMLYRSLSGNS